MTPVETLLVVFSVLIVGGTSYELYNETKSHHHKTKSYRHSEKYNNDRKHVESNKGLLGLFNTSRKNKNKSGKLSTKQSRKVSSRKNDKLFNIFKDTVEKKPTSKKLRSRRSKKHSSSMTSLEKRQYYLNKFKHNVHKTKKRRRRIYI
jgi:hypothetical protein